MMNRSFFFGSVEKMRNYTVNINHFRTSILYGWLQQLESMHLYHKGSKEWCISITDSTLCFVEVNFFILINDESNSWDINIGLHTIMFSRLLTPIKELSNEILSNFWKMERRIWSGRSFNSTNERSISIITSSVLFSDACLWICM